jgi:hypothetical protein
LLSKLEAALKCRSFKKGRCAPPVHMIKLTETREITPYVWVHPDEERLRCVSELRFCSKYSRLVRMQ